MRGQVLIGVAVLIFVITLLLLVTLPKRTIGPTVDIENYTIAQLEVEQILRNAAEETAYSTANTLEAILTTPTENPQDLASSLKEYYAEQFNVTFTDKAGAYAALRGVLCKLDTLDVEVGEGNNYVYISSIYAVATCDNGVMAFINTAAHVELEFKNLGAFGGVKAAVNLTSDQQQIQLITYAAALYNVTNGVTYRFPIMGAFNPAESVWYFNITGLHYIQVAVPPEYCMMATPTYYIAIVATSVGEGAATVIIAQPTGKICGT